MKKIAAVSLLLACVLASGASGQKNIKSWVEWSKKDAQKILNDSPWGKMQVDTDTAEMFYSPTSRAAVTDSRRVEQGANNQAVSLKFYIRFLSAKPIRQAFARLIELQQASPDPQLSERLRGFTNSESNEWIFIAVSFESNDRRVSGPVMQAFNAANTGVLKNKTYLERKDGKRLFLHEYLAPTADGMGAKFSFPRLVDGQPFITAASDEVRFYSEFSDKLKLNMRFKVAHMMYDGRLEY